MPATTLALILAGGASRRFGGRDKAWLRFAGRPMICHVVERLAPQVDAIVVSSNRHHWAYRRFGMRTIADRPGWRGRGPLAAIATVMSAMRPQRLVLVPVDMPRIPNDLVSCLGAVLVDGVPAAAAFDGSRRQPLCCLLDGRLAVTAQMAIEQEPIPSMQAWLEGVGVRWVAFGDDPSAFININDAGDLERYRNGGPTCARE
jgi:molybdopterin-guanine dinucleotide biosynthesis protein A